jgi:hypothetical protein
VEGVGGLAAVRGRIGEPVDEVDVLEDRAGPAVAEHHRQRARHGRPDMEEVHRLAVDAGAELRIGVEPVLPPPPVEFLPLGHQPSQATQRDSVGAVVGSGRLLGCPSGHGETMLQVIHLGLRDPGGERLDHGAGSRCCAGTE